MTIDDKHIIEAIRSNPENGFRKLLTKYKDPIYWHIRRIVVVHDDAQDAAQETFVRVFRNFNSCEGSDKLCEFFATAISLFTSCITFDSNWLKKLSGT